MFSPAGYRTEAIEFRNAAERGEATSLKAADNAAKNATGREAVLFTLEEARLRSLGGDVEGSIRGFQNAVDLFEDERQQPAIRASEAFFSAAALATNDRFLTYQTSGYERVMAHNFLALEFLKSEDAERAQVALNGGIAEMDYQRERAKALEKKSESSARQSSLSTAATASATAQVRSQLEASALPGLEAYQSAFTFYLASALFELQGDPNRAEIAMRRAGNLYPKHPAIIDAVAHGWRTDPEDALIVLIIADSWVPLRDEIRLPLFWKDTILQIVMPTYGGGSERWGSYGAELSIEGGSPLRSSVITDVSAQARKSLADEYPAIFIRQALRLIAKYQIQKQLEQESSFAGFAAQVFNLITDQADLRSWSTLPSTLQVAHSSLPAGFHRLSLNGFPTPSPIEATLPPGSTLFVIIEQTGPTYRQSTILFE